MSRKDREGPSKRQELRDKRRRTEQRNRWILFGVIVVVAVLFVSAVVYQQLRPTGIVVPTPMVTGTVDRNTVGNANAPVKLDEFSDYQCPYCKDFWQKTEQQVEEAYAKTGKVQFVARSAGNWVSRNSGGDSTESQDSAMAAYCAADQNKFWQMHDALFASNRDVEEQGSFTISRLQKIASSVGLDMNAYNSCMSSNKYLAQTQTDFQDAQNAGIQGTPFFVIKYTVNGKEKTDTIDGAQPFAVFQQKLDAALAAAGAK